MHLLWVYTMMVKGCLLLSISSVQLFKAKKTCPFLPNFDFFGFCHIALVDSIKFKFYKPKKHILA